MFCLGLAFIFLIIWTLVWIVSAQVFCHLKLNKLQNIFSVLREKKNTDFNTEQ